MTTWNKENTGKPDTTDFVRSSIDLIASRINNVENGLSGDESLDSVVIEGGTIDGTPIGVTKPDTGNFTIITVDNITIDGNTISSDNGVVNAFGVKPDDETGATLVVDISGYTTTYYNATTGWYTLEMKGAGGSAGSDVGANGYAGGYMKTSFYVPYSLSLRCTSSSASSSEALAGGGSSVVSSSLHKFICGGGAGAITFETRWYGGHDGHAYSGSGFNGGLGGEIPTANLGYTSGTSTSPEGGNNLNTTRGGGGAGGVGGGSPRGGTNGSIKLWKH
jgi:hypothetical protein